MDNRDRYQEAEYELYENGDDPDETLRIQVDPWTGEVLEDPSGQYRVSPWDDPDRTSRVIVDPHTGVLLGVLDNENDQGGGTFGEGIVDSEGPSELQPPLNFEQAKPNFESPWNKRLELGLSSVGLIATIALTAGAAAGSIVALLIQS